MRPDRLVFTDTTGRTLTTRDLEGVTGRVPWAAVGSQSVPAEAMSLHRKAQMAGTRGDPRRALELLDRARALAPGWPYPVYDAARTHLLEGDAVTAEGVYAEVDRLAPRGFLACQPTLYGLRRERTGELPPASAGRSRPSNGSMTCRGRRPFSKASWKGTPRSHPPGKSWPRC